MSVHRTARKESSSLIRSRAALERNDAASAIKHWEKLVTLVPADSEMARDIKASINEARAMAGKPVGKPVATDAGVKGVSGTVTLAPALNAKVKPDDVVFVFARAAQVAEGPRMPLAILKRKVSELPLKFTLDDSMAMSPAAKISTTPQVIVGARISKSGEAMPRAGDLQGASAPVKNDASGVAVVIDTEVQ